MTMFDLIRYPLSDEPITLEQLNSLPSTIRTKYLNDVFDNVLRPNNQTNRGLRILTDKELTERLKQYLLEYEEL